MLSRLAGVLAFLVCILFVAPAGARQELLPTLVFDSAEIDYSGVELLMRFKYTPPPATTHPYLSDTIMPELEDGNSTSYPLTRKGANFEVIENENEDEVLWWTLRYRIDSDPRVTHDQAGFTVSWWGGPLASTETGVAVHTASSGTDEPVTNRSRVDANGWTHLPLRTGTGVTAAAPDGISGLYAWYSPPDTGYSPFWQDAAGTVLADDDGEPVGRWTDRSGNSRHLTQPNTDNKPLLRDSVLNGHHTVEFNGRTSGDALSLYNSSFNLHATASDLSIIAVVRSNGNSDRTNPPNPGKGYIVQQGNSSSESRGHHLFLESHDADYTMGAPGHRPVKARTLPGGSGLIQSVDAGSPHGEWLIVASSWEKDADPATSGTLRGWNLGAQTYTATGTTNAVQSGENPDTWSIGGRFDGWNGLNGDIVEIVVYDTALSDTDAKALTQHFMDKYEVYPRTIYVNSAKSDDNGTGLTTAGAKKTVAAGVHLARTGVGDRVLFKLGSVFNPGQFTPKSGWSFEHPTLYGTYVFEEGGMGELLLPTARPVFKIAQDVDDGIIVSGATPVHDIAFVGLDLYSHQRDPANNPVSVIDGVNGINLKPADLRRILIEDCVVRWFDYNINIAIESPNEADDIIIRRNIIRNAYDSQSGVAPGARSSGIYLETPGTTRLLVEENVTHENGWYNGTTPSGMGEPDPNTLSHNMYFQARLPAAKGYVVRGNLSTYGASHGLQLRPGGVVDSNLFYQNAIHAFTADNRDGSTIPATTTPSLVWRCVFLEARPTLMSWHGEEIGGEYVEEARGWGYAFNGSSDTIATENIFSMPDPTDEADGRAVQLYAVTGEEVDEVGEDRYYFRNNTVWAADTVALRRERNGGDDPKNYKFREVVSDYNLLVQPDALVGTLLGHWQYAEDADLGGVYTNVRFADNYYFSDGDDPTPAEWFKETEGGVTTALTIALWLANTDDTTSVTNGSEPTFVETGRDMGQYYRDVLLGGSTKTSEDLIADKFLARKRGQWVEDETAAAIIDWIRDGYTPVCFDLAPDGRHYGAMPYSECLGLNGGGGGCEGDFDRDGAVTVADLAAFQRAYIQGHRRADLNRDGLLNVGDLAAFQSALSAGCP